MGRRRQRPGTMSVLAAYRDVLVYPFLFNG
jgi:hypothetical protein